MGRLPVLRQIKLLNNIIQRGCPFQFIRHSTSFQHNKIKKQSSEAPNRKHAHQVPTFPQLFVQTAPKNVKPYLELIRLDKPIGTWLLYLPCTWSIALAASPGTWPSFYYLTIFGIGAMCMRGAGCTINDMWDRDIDSKVARTKIRPIASGQISQSKALVFLAGQLSVSLGLLLQLNWYCVGLGIASMGLVVTYPLMKRIIDWPQLILGLAFNWGALMGYAAVHGSCDWLICVPLYIAGISWTMIYDTVYAHQDRPDDLVIGVKSTAISFGDKTEDWLKAFTLTMISSLTMVGITSHQTWPYYLAIGTVAAQQVYQIAKLNINNAEDCLQQFRAQKYTGLLIFLGIVTSGLMAKQGDDDKVKLEVLSENDDTVS